ncbi:NAD(P)/FAD-dependent oxidoreductase [Rhodococcus sp. NPDC058521]|uniref:NAD(P)/FAD-dependent oxidoreductase n=1 Tax=Rhodococcus sp. NPDC058521 TaxID=3346536 RepID=UPI00366448C2
MTTDSLSNAVRVVIVGAGFAGFEAAEQITRKAKKSNTNVAVTLVSADDFMLYTPLLPEVAGGLLDPRFVAVPLNQTLPGVDVIAGRVESVDLDGKQVQYVGRGGETAVVPWDRLVLTPGSVTRLFDIPGLREHALGLKSTTEALYLRDQLLRELELASQTEDSALAEQHRTVVIVGASYAGTELVSQMRALADEVAEKRHFDPSSVRFVLLDVAKQVMPEVGDKLSHKVLDVLRERGIDVRLETSLESVSADHVVLTDGTRVPTRTVVWAAGVTANPLIATLGLPTEKGRLKVGTDLAVDGHPDVFAAGDAAAVPDLTEPGSVTPPTAQHAIRQGKALARNVLASVGTGTAKPYKHSNLGLVVDLGPGFAVANPVGVHLSGLPAKAVTRGYHLFSLPRGVNRWAVAMGYVTDVFADRSLVSFGTVTGDEAKFYAQGR